eukprot:6490316-Amphidinium_carterae.1
MVTHCCSRLFYHHWTLGPIHCNKSSTRTGITSGIEQTRLSLHSVLRPRITFRLARLQDHLRFRSDQAEPSLRSTPSDPPLGHLTAAGSAPLSTLEPSGSCAQWPPRSSPCPTLSTCRTTRV